MVRGWSTGAILVYALIYLALVPYARQNVVAFERRLTDAYGTGGVVPGTPGGITAMKPDGAP